MMLELNSNVSARHDSNTATLGPHVFNLPVNPTYSKHCPSRDKQYLAIIITILPLWAILTTLIVFVLLTFHKNLRATKVYDNCTKNNAKYIYYVEIRTGETSITYIKRKTIISIDMFDENLNTVARIAVPGHVIFGSRSKPSSIVEDDKYPELRATRFWLYRVSKLKRVSTIRLTHSCSEPEAKIMVYGIQIRGDSIEDKLFFPVMSYISAYGSATKPNVCFDSEPTGTISAMGGSISDPSSICGQLNWVDYMLLTYLLLSLVFHISSYDIIHDSFEDYSQACIKGVIVGTISYLIVSVLGLFFRFIIKQNYSIRIGTGFWAVVYYSFCITIFIISTSLWIVITIESYKYMCPAIYNEWVLSITLAIILSAILTLLVVCISWIIQLVNPKSMEQYVFPDEQLFGQETPQGSKSHQTQLNQYRYQNQSGPLKTPLMSPMNYSHQAAHQAGWQNTGPYTSPYQGGNMYSQPIMMNPMLNSPSYKTLQTTYNTNYEPQTTMQPTNLQPQQQQNQATTYHQQTSGSPTNGMKAGAPGKKTGSNESTGSSYYQQLMKNKGGVKSISQYGELLRQKKAAAKQVTPK